MLSATKRAAASFQSNQNPKNPKANEVKQRNLASRQKNRKLRTARRVNAMSRIRNDG